MSHSHDPDEEEVRRAVENWEDANREIVNALGIKAAVPAVQAIKAFTLHQANPDDCNERRAMSLTAGLDVLAKHYTV